jgi:hypothetical protein
MRKRSVGGDVLAGYFLDGDGLRERSATLRFFSESTGLVETLACR